MTIPRMTTRRWMTAVAVMAVLLAVGRLAGTTWKRLGTAAAHARLADTIRLNGSTIASVAAVAPSEAARRSHHEAMARHSRFAEYYSDLATRYRRAARYPWLPVPPDPPEPR